MISQVKSKNDVCSQEMYGYGSQLKLFFIIQKLQE